MTITYRVRPPITNEDLNALYAVSWPAHETFDFSVVLERCLVHVCAFEDRLLIGSVYVAWDGSQHAFLLEPTVHADFRRRGVGRELVRLAEAASREAGCEWLHVDYEAELAPFYASCGFRPTEAGLIRL